MKEFETDYIEKLIDIMKNNELTEVTLEDNDKSLVIKTNGYTPAVRNVQCSEEEACADTVSPDSETAPAEEKKNLVPVISNMIGLYYSRPKPDAEPYVKIGDEVKEGQEICIIETIKLVNKIKSEVSGRVAELCIEDGKPVEYGQVIMYIEKN